MSAREGADDRSADLLGDAAAFFEAHLWEASGSAARNVLAREGLEEETIRAFEVGFAPIGPDVLMNHLRRLGYSTDEMVEAGLAHRSVRGRAHAQFRSRIMFPVRDADGQILGFAGLATHVGPSWALWNTSPDVGPYRRSRGVFGLDRAAPAITDSGAVRVERDSIEVLRAHQEGRANVVTVQTPRVTSEQMLAMAEPLPGGLDALELELAPGMQADPKEEQALAALREGEAPSRGVEEPKPVRHLEAKKTLIVIATALAAVNLWTGAPLLAVWIGSHAQGGRVLSLQGVVIVLVVLGLFAFLLAWVLSWLHAKYDELTGRPPTVTRTSPWQRRMRGELDEHLRDRFDLSPPERVLAACVIIGALGFELWFFFLAGSSLPNT
jgi:DNA primase catalytic core, N-terminal domain